MKKILLLVFIAWASLLKAQNADSIQVYLSEAMNSFDQEGMTVGVIKNGKLVYQQAFGYANVELKTQLNVASVFELASLSKAFTAASLGILVDNGLIKWDDPVKKHFPEFKMHDDYVTENMLVEDLLCHRNGYNTFDGDLLWYGTHYSSREMVSRFAKLAPKHHFRTEYGYSNLNFINAAIVIENVSGRTWADFLQDSILKPLGMNDSYVHLEDFTRRVNKAYPHVGGKTIEFQNFDEAIGAVGVRSNVLDLAKWASMWMHEGMLPDSTFLLEKSTVHKIFSLHTPQFPSESNIAEGKLFGGAALGWFTSLFHGTRLMQHSGGLPGYILNLAIMPEEDLAVVVLTNGETILPFAATNYLLEQYLADENPKDWVSTYLPFHEKRKEKKEAIKLNQSPMKVVPSALVGVYEDKMYGQAEIKMKGNQLHLVFLPTKEYFFSDMKPIGDYAYRIKFADEFLPEGKLNVEVDANNYPIGFTIDLPNPDFHFYNLNFKKKN
ncbi:MAG: serine hydrolase [Luteibaculum sp.]